MVGEKISIYQYCICLRDWMWTGNYNSIEEGEIEAFIFIVRLSDLLLLLSESF